MAFFAYFEIDIVEALASQLVAAFEALDIGELSPEALEALDSGQGVYMLFHAGRLVYVGKADDLRKRLGEHRRKIAGRLNIDVTRMGFKCLFIHRNWTTLAPETSLIRHYQMNDPGSCEWNGSGFGPHDPGRQRDTTNKPPDGFDAKYPINVNWQCDGIQAGTWNVRELLMAIKRTLPYLFRYEVQNTKSWQNGHPVYNDREVEVSGENLAAIELVRLVAEKLDWQATYFPSHIILYNERRQYRFGAVIHPRAS